MSDHLNHHYQQLPLYILLYDEIGRKSPASPHSFTQIDNQTDGHRLAIFETDNSKQ